MRAHCLVALILSLSIIAHAADGDGLPPLGTLTASKPLLIRSGQTLAFMGDSITDFGDKMPGGYCRLVIWTLRQYGVDVKPLYAGHGGDMSVDMLNRLDRDVLAKKPEKPDWMTLSAGVNDVWRHDKGQTLEQFSHNITEIVDKCSKSGTKVILLTPTMINEDVKSDDNQKLRLYSDWMVRFAAERKLTVVDLNKIMHDAIQNPPFPGLKIGYTGDGVHPNPIGNRMMARGILNSIGLTKREIDAVHDRWLDLPNGWVVPNTDLGVPLKAIVTTREYPYLAFAPTWGPAVLYAIPKDVIASQLKDHGGPYGSKDELTHSPHFPDVLKQMQAECDRKLSETVAQCKKAFDQYLTTLSAEQRRAMQAAEP